MKMCQACERDLDERPHHPHCPVLWEQTNQKAREFGMQPYTLQSRDFPAYKRDQSP
jgi:hypothetical protein